MALVASEGGNKSSSIVGKIWDKPAPSKTKQKAAGALALSPFGLLPAGIGALLGGLSKESGEDYQFTSPGMGEGYFYNKYGDNADNDTSLSAIISSLGLKSKGSKGKPNLPGVNYGQSNDDLARARDLVQLEYGAKESGLQRAMKGEKKTYQQLLGDLEEALKHAGTVQTEYGKAGDVKLQQLYAALSGDLQRGLENTQSIYNEGQGEIEQAYQQAQATQQQGAGQINQGLQAVAQQLGLGAAVPENLAQLQGEQANIQGRTAQSGAGAESNIIARGADEAAVMQQSIAGSQKQGAQDRANLALSVSDALAQINIEGAKGRRDLQRNLQDSLTELSGQLADIRGERGTALREAVRQVTEARGQNERQRRLDTLNEHLQLTQLEMQQEEQSTNVEMGQLGLEEAKIKLDMLKQQAMGGQSIDPMEIIKLSADTYGQLSIPQIMEYLKQIQGGGSFGASAAPTAMQSTQQKLSSHFLGQ